ncbi:helix-turn-helix domain-containing protein [Pararoseomonas indoligenes]|uniref:Helix-turn-helix transcriptional regulator n=1 Tax=Roseomonas indoligenes TaxID=2820811 RepID=A0A940S7A7_9PROT|nr:helix-turn-helix transcriptional regulator [Pararoseomonas indoligenes]
MMHAQIRSQIERRGLRGAKPLEERHTTVVPNGHIGSQDPRALQAMESYSRRSDIVPMPARSPSAPAAFQTLTQWREYRGLTQEQVGNKLGVGSQAVHKWEAGKVLLTVDRLRQLAEIYDTTADALLFPPQEEDQATRLRRANRILHGMTPEQAERWLSFAEEMLPKKG